MEYVDFRQAVIDFIEHNDLTSNPYYWKEYLEDDLPEGFSIRVEDEALVFDAKGYGQGDVSLVEEENQDAYLEAVSVEVDNFHDSWDKQFQSQFEAPLKTFGKYDRWWGFSLKDITGYNNVALAFNENILKSLYKDFEESIYSKEDNAKDFLEYGEDDVLDKVQGSLTIYGPFKKELEKFAEEMEEASNYLETEDFLK